MRKNLYPFVVFSVSVFVLYSFQWTDLSNPLLKNVDSFWLSLADKVITGTYILLSLIVKIMLLGLAFVLLAPAANKTKYFVYLSFISTLQLINDISNDLQKLESIFRIEP